MLFTLFAGDKTFTASSLESLALKVQAAQKFGSYPIWQYNDDEAEDFDVPGAWERFDGAQPKDEGEPEITPEEILSYTCWSLQITACSLMSAGGPKPAA